MKKSAKKVVKAKVIAKAIKSASASASALAPKPKFHVGQVVRIDTTYYSARALKGERYQRITQVWDWTPHDAKTPGFGYTFLNGDRCNEKWIVALTKREKGYGED